MQVSKATSGTRRLFAWLNMNYNNGVNTEVKEKNEPKQRELNKIGKLDDFWDSLWYVFSIKIKFSQHFSKNEL